MEQLVYIAVGKKIRSIRKNQKLTQRDLALLLGVSQSSISNLEKGVYPVTLHVLIKVAAALHTSMKIIFSEID
ncbi:helix-turn-helix transcriptional regulator [Paenibacillus sp. FSL L8-0696]|uniref:helix-turn-helix domain-containing protein n=1 Tax=unclassified Paenibacillus TaxID=185978 RepID=UPI0004F92716|nr:helix-turn-helix transcriptional regulator [Paenibacillus sp. FSL R5-0345]AIQ35990.1 hypothetical protein R50345_16010 [Paenibacillus sp. FSL R5-0345]